MRTNQQPSRPAFTLIELLVVIAIIGILATIAVVAVFQISGSTVRQTQTRTEIGNLEVAVAAAQQELGQVSYLPSRIQLCETLSAYTDPLNPDPTLAAASLAFLRRAFGKNIFNNGANTINWNGDATDGGQIHTLLGD